MLKRKKSIIAQKQAELQLLNLQSSRALDVVTSTINNLATVNEKIDVVVSEIAEAKAQLDSTESSLVSTKEKNSRIIGKFKSLIED